MLHSGILCKQEADSSIKTYIPSANASLLINLFAIKLL